ncbi:MAG TPA: hypothetical protein VF292_13210 [Rhodanobacteraceae bacterium]
MHSTSVPGNAFIFVMFSGGQPGGGVANRSIERASLANQSAHRSFDNLVGLWASQRKVGATGEIRIDANVYCVKLHNATSAGTRRQCSEVILSVFANQLRQFRAPVSHMAATGRKGRTP